jgi:endonuclease G
MATKNTAATARATHQRQLLDKMRSYVRTKAAQLLADPNISSVGIGRKQTAGKADGALAIQFTVNSKVAPEQVEGIGSTPIPEHIEIDGVAVPTDVIERSYKPSYIAVQIEAKDPRKVRADTVVPGLSVGNRFTTAGTIGAFVRDRTSGAVVLLSNWHVLHGGQAQVGADIVQPGRHDDNRVDRNVMGTLLRSHLGPAGDCAIASVFGRALSGEVMGLGVSVDRIADPEIGDRVVKSGRTTAVTRGRVVRIEVNTKMSYPDGVSAVVGGFEIGIDEDAVPLEREISRGGDSGAAWLAVARGKPTGVMLGLHFAGDAEGTAAEFALACYAKSVMTALDVEPVGAFTTALAAQAATDEEALRTGFDPHFAGFAVPVPTFTASRRKDLAVLDDEVELRYCHFSAWLSRTRKYPLCVAWNIDGNGFRRMQRTGFRADRRGDLEDFQLTDAIYVRNPFDKGHIARRADLCWGAPEEARQGNFDSSFYSNIVPQHEAFNESTNRDDDAEGGVWGRLENTLLDTEAPRGLRIALMAGPVFGSKDRTFTQDGESCRVPDEFWKVVAFIDEEDGREKVYGFLLTQKHLVAPLTTPESLALDLEDWVWARITLRDLEARTGVRFAKTLHTRESPFSVVQQLDDAPALKLLDGPADYFA